MDLLATPNPYSPPTTVMHRRPLFGASLSRPTLATTVAKPERSVQAHAVAAGRRYPGKSIPR